MELRQQAHTSHQRGVGRFKERCAGPYVLRSTPYYEQGEGSLFAKNARTFYIARRCVTYRGRDSRVFFDTETGYRESLNYLRELYLYEKEITGDHYPTDRDDCMDIAMALGQRTPLINRIKQRVEERRDSSST